MRPSVTDLFKIGLVFSAAVAVICVAAGVWAVRCDPFGNRGIPFGNKRLFAWRVGVADYRVVLTKPPPVFTMWARPPSDAELLAEEEGWGEAKHWLRLPEVGFSLWWPFACSVVLPAWWCVRRLRGGRAGRGFPLGAEVEAIKGDAVRFQSESNCVPLSVS